MGHRMLRKGGLTEETVIQCFTLVTLDGMGAINPLTGKVMRIKVLAKRRMAFVAGMAVITIKERQHHMVAHVNGRDLVSNRLDHTRPFVAKNDGMGHRENLITGDHVRVAHAGGNDAHAHFVDAHFLERYFLNDKGATFLADDCCEKCLCHCSTAPRSLVIAR